LGEAVVEQLSADLRTAFPDMKGFSRDNVFRMRQFFLACRDLDLWLTRELSIQAQPGSSFCQLSSENIKVGAPPRQLTEELQRTLSEKLCGLVLELSWTSLTII
jgi:hypothetical protein